MKPVHSTAKVPRSRRFLSTGIRSLVPSLTLLLASVYPAAPAGAATGTWNVDANTTNWGTSTNWLGGVVPNGIDDIANFTFNISAARTITLDGTRVLGGMTLGDPTTAFFGYTITSNTQGGVLVFDTSAGNANLTFSAASTAANALNVPLVLNDTLNVHSLNAVANALNGNISGTGGLIFDASGTHGSGISSLIGQATLTGVNTFSGGLTTTETRITVGGSYSLGSGAVTVNDGGQIYLANSGTYYNNFTLNTLGWNETTQAQLGAIRSDGTSILAGTITLAGTSRLAGTGGTTLVNNAIVESGGSYNLEINRLQTGGASSASTWVFKGANAYTGKTTVYSGTLRIGDSGTTGSLGTTSSLEFANATIEYRRSDNVTVTTPFTQLTGTIGGVAVTGSNFVHSGLGTLTLDNGASGYLGTTTVNALNSKLVIGSGGAYNFAGTGNVAISNGADIEFKTSSNIQIGGGANPAGQAFSAAANSYLIQSGTGTITLGGTTDDNNGRAIVNSGTLVLNKETAAIHALGSSNDLGLIVNGGTVQYGALAAADQIYTQTDVQINGGTVDFNGKNDGFDVLTGTGGVITNSAASTASTLTLGENNSNVNPLNLVAYNSSYGGSIQDGGGTMALAKTGTGVQTLTGAHTYTGGTTISAGTLAINGSLAANAPVTLSGTGVLAGTGSVGDVTMAAGTSLRPGATAFDNAPAATLTLNSLSVNGGDIRLNLGTSNDAIVVTNSAIFSGASTLTPTFSTLPVAGTTTLITAAGGMFASTLPTLTVPATTRSTFALNPTGATLDLVVSGPGAKSLTWTGTTSGAWDLNATANFDSAGAEKFFNLDGVTFGDGPANRIVTLAAGLNPTSITVNNSAGNDYTFQTGTLVGGGLSISKTGNGVLNLNTANTFGGAVTITGGTVKAGSATALGDAGGQTFVSGGGTLDVNGQNLGAEVVNISGTGVGGNGALVNSGAAQQNAFRFITLTGNATIGGANRLDIRATASGETLDLAGFTLTKTGASFFGAVNVNVTSGNIVVNGGTMEFESGTLLQGTGAVTYNAGTTAYFYATTATNITRPMVWNGGVTVDTGGQTSGVNSNITLGGDATFVATVNTLTLNGVISQTGGARSLVKSGAGTLTLNGNNSFTGGITSTGGTINLGGSNTTAGPVNLTSTTLQVLGATNVDATLGNASSISLNGSTLRLNLLSNYTLPATTLSTVNGSSIIFNGQTQASTLTVNTPVGTTTALNSLSVEQGTVTLASGANVTVNAANVGTISQGASGNIGTLNVLPGASLTALTSFLGEGAAGRSGFVNQSGGAVSILGNDTGNDGTFRIGHWSGAGSTYNLSGGTLSVPNGTTSIGVDGTNAFLNISGGTASLYRLLVDGRGTTAPIGGTLNLSGGELSIGAGGLASFAGSQFNFTGGMLSAYGSSTWSAGFYLESTAPVINTNGNNVALTAAIVGTGGFTKTGNGALIVSNAAVNNTGAINVTGGVLAVTGQLTAASAVNVNNGGTLAGAGNGTTTGRVTNVVLNTGGTIRPGADGFDSTVGNLAATTLNFNGGTLQPTLNPTTFTTGGTTNDLVTVNGAMTLNGGFILPIWSATPNSGTYTLATSTALTVNTLPSIAPAAVSRLSYTVGTSGNNLTLTVSGSVASLSWSGAPGGNNWDANTTQNWKLVVASDEKFLAYDNVTFNDTDATPGTVNIVGTVLPGSTTVDTAGTYTFSGPGSIGGGSLSKFGLGTLIIANDNTMPGTISISSGTLQFGTGGTSGSLDGGAASLANVNIANNGIIDYNRSNYALYSKVMSGSGSLVKDGTGTLELTSRSTFTGPTTVNSGILRLNAANAGNGTLGASGALVTINSAGTIESGVNGFGSTVAQINPLVINGGTLRQLSADSHLNLLTLSAATITGNAGTTNELHSDVTVQAAATSSTISVPTLQLVGGGALQSTAGAITFNVDDGAAATDLVVTSATTGTGLGLVKAGTGTMVHSGNISSTGGIFQNAGSLTLSGTISGTTPITANAGSLILSGTVTTTGTITGNGGTLTISGTLNDAPAGLVANGGIIDATTTNAFGGNAAAGATGVSIASRPAQKATTGGTATGLVSVTVAATADLKVGMTVTGTNVPAGARIAAITSATTFDLTTAVGATAIVTATNINFGPAPMLLNGGTFRYSAATAATDDRLINVSTTGGTFDASGAGAITLSGALQFNGQTGARTFTLAGTSTAANTYTGLLADNTGATKIVKSGSGAWAIAGANTYTGGTTVSAGELRLSGASALGTATVTLGDASTGTSNVALYLDATRTTYIVPIVVSNNGTGTATLGSRATVGGTGANNSFQGITLQRDVILDSNAADRTDYRTISGTGNISIVGTGRTVFLTTNSFVGDLTVAPTGAGFFQIGVATAGNQNYIPDTSSVNVVTGSRFAVSVGGETINALSGGGLVNVNAINAILTVGFANGSGDFSGVLANATQTLGLTKIGTGTQTLSGINTYTAATTVSNGTLVVNGSISGSATTVSGANATLAGLGTAGPVTLTSGTVTAGSNNIGTLTTGNLALNGGQGLFELAGNSADKLSVVGTVAFGAPVALNLSFNSDLAEGTVFTLVANDSNDAITLAGGGGFALSGVPIAPGVDFGYTSGAFSETFQLSYTGGDGNDAILTVVPEPGTTLALLGGLGVLFARRRRRNH